MSDISYRDKLKNQNLDDFTNDEKKEDSICDCGFMQGSQGECTCQKRWKKQEARRTI